MKYSNGSGGTFELPRTEFLLHKVKEIERNLIKWYKSYIYNQGDSYQCSLTKEGKWKVSHSNDYPMQHGKGNHHIFTDKEFLEANK